MNIIYIQSTAGRPISWTTSSMNSSFLASFALCSRSWITDGERSFLATGFLIEICSCPDWKPLLSAFRGAARNYPRQNSSRTGNVLDAIFVRGWHAALVTKVATIYSRGEYAPDRVVRDTRKRSNSLILWSNKIYRNPLDPFETLGRWKSSIDRWIMILRFLFSLFTYDFFFKFLASKMPGGSIALVTRYYFCYRKYLDCDHAFTKDWKLQKYMLNAYNIGKISRKYSNLYTSIK